MQQTSSTAHVSTTPLPPAPADAGTTDTADAGDTGAGEPPTAAGADSGHDQPTARPRIRPRNMRHPFDASIPRHWFGGNAVATQLANGVNLLFPHGERFFIRSVKHYLDAIRDDLSPEDMARIRAFFGQEGHHAREHERYFEILEQQGYDIRPFLASFERWTGRLERSMPPAIRLSVTAAVEHFTAILAEAALQNRFVDIAHPTMAGLLLWHAAEELEHKSVAYDVLQRVNPSYALRVIGLLAAGGLLAGWWRVATRMLLAQDGIGWRERRRLRAQMRAYRDGKSGVSGVRMTNPVRDVFLRGLREYLRPSFHPDDNDNYHLAKDYLASIGRAEA